MDLNIRDVPEELGKAVRVAAANAGISIRGWVIRVLEGAVSDKYKPGTVVTVTRKDIKATAEPVRKGAIEKPTSGGSERRGRQGFVAGPPEATPPKISKSDQLRALRERNSK